MSYAMQQAECDRVIFHKWKVSLKKQSCIGILKKTKIHPDFSLDFMCCSPAVGRLTSIALVAWIFLCE